MENDNQNPLAPYSTDAEVNAAFRNGSVFTANDQHLTKLLNTLCAQEYDNAAVRHRAIIMGTTLGDILLLNAIRRMNHSNNWIAVGALVVALIALIFKH